MKRVIAIIKPYRIDKVEEALRAVDGFDDAIYTDSRGIMHFREDVHAFDFITNIRLEAVVNDRHVKKITKAIQLAARVNYRGAGLIWVESVDQLVSIETGDVFERSLKKPVRKIGAGKKENLKPG